MHPLERRQTCSPSFTVCQPDHRARGAAGFGKLSPEPRQRHGHPLELERCGGETNYTLHDGTHTLLQTLGYDITSTLESVWLKHRLHPACPCHERAGCRAGLVFRDKYTKVHQAALGDFTVTAVGQTGPHIVLTTLPPNSTAGSTAWNVERSPDRINWYLAKNWDQNYTSTTPIFSR